MAASPENFTLDSGHYENMPLNAELLEHFTQFARAVQKHDGTPAFSEQTLVELSKAVRGESLVKPQVFAFTLAADNSELQAVLVAVPSPEDSDEPGVLEAAVHPQMRGQGLGSTQKIAGLTNTLQGSSINTIRHMVASGLAISVLPATALTENDHLLFSIIPFAEKVPTRRVVLAYRRNFVRPKALAAIRNAIIGSQLAGVNFTEKNGAVPA